MEGPCLHLGYTQLLTKLYDLLGSYGRTTPADSTAVFTANLKAT